MKTSPFHLAFCLTSLLATVPAQAAPQLALRFPGPTETTLQRSEALASFRLAIGPFRGGEIATELAEGALDQTAWRIALPGIDAGNDPIPARADRQRRLQDDL